MLLRSRTGVIMTAFGLTNRPCLCIRGFLPSKLFFFLKHHVMKTYGAEELQFHALLNCALREMNRQLQALADLLLVKNPSCQMDKREGGWYGRRGEEKNSFTTLSFRN
jgi:hypothetical protein